MTWAERIIEEIGDGISLVLAASLIASELPDLLGDVGVHVQHVRTWPIFWMLLGLRIFWRSAAFPPSRYRGQP